MSDGNTRPFLRSEYSTTITNAHQLQLMATNLAANYTLANDVDLGELKLATGMWNTDTSFVPTATGFVPVGDGTNAFTGQFDGMGHTITSLSIDRSAQNYVGLFGYSTGTISNIGLVSGSVSGANNVGGLVGSNSGNITNAYSTGGVGGNDAIGGLVGSNSGNITNAYGTGKVRGFATVGGLVGSNSGNITNAYSTGVVKGIEDIGGLVGANDSTISNAYSTGVVSGSGTYVGGLVGSNAGLLVTNSFWNKDTETNSNQDTPGAGTGLTTAQMMAQSNYPTTPGTPNGWDFANTWVMADGHTYPYLQALTQLVAGNLIGGNAGNTITVVQNGNTLGSPTTNASGFYYLALTANTIPTGHSLLSYLTTGGTAATVRLSDGNSLTGVDLALNALTVGSNSPAAVSNTDIATAKGSLTDIAIPYAAVGNNITLSNGVAFQTATDTNYTLNGDITTSNASQSFNGPVSLASNATLSSGIGYILFVKSLDGGFSLSINSTGTTIFNGTVGGSKPLAALTTDAGGKTNINTFDIFTSTTAGQVYNDAVKLLNVDTVLTADNGGAVHFASTVDGPANLYVLGSGDGITTFNGTVGNTTPLKSLTTRLTGSTVFTGGSIKTTNSQTYQNSITLGGDTSLDAGSTISISGNMNSNGGGINLTADGIGITATTVDAGSGLITLKPYSSGTVIKVGGNVADGTGILGLSQSEIGTLRSTTGVTIGDPSNTGGIQFVGSADFGNLKLVTVGNISQTAGTLTAGTLSGSATGTTLNGSNTITTLGNFSATGTFSLTDNANLLVTGPVSGAGVSLTIVGASHSLALNSNVNGGAGRVTLNAAAGATQNAAGVITASGLELLGGAASNYTLNTATNQVGILAGNAGAVSLKDGTALSVGAAGGSTGLLASGNVALQTTVGALLCKRPWMRVPATCRWTRSPGSPRTRARPGASSKPPAACRAARARPFWTMPITPSPA